MKKIFSVIIALAMAVTAVAATAVMPASAEDVIKVACVGDSITDNGKTVNAYPAQLNEMLGDSYELGNFGCSGATAMKGGFWDYRNSNEYKNSLTFEPDIVIIMLGTNDALADNREKAKTNFKADYIQLIGMYQALETAPEIYIALTPWAKEEEMRAFINDVIIPAEKEIAEELGLNIVDINKATEGFSQYYKDDGVHPNNNGYYLLAQTYYKEVFGGEIYDVTVETTANTTVCVGGFTTATDADGRVTVPTANGKRTFTVNIFGKNTVSKTVDVTGDTAVNIPSDIETVPNLAIGATVIEELGGRQHYNANRLPENINDGDSKTDWQVTGEPTNPIENLWIGYDFKEAKEFNRIVIWWQEGVACQTNGFAISYSDDGESWNEVSNLTVARAGATDTCDFDQITARFVRVQMLTATSGKYMPQVYEIEVYNDIKEGGDIKPPATLKKGDVNGDGNINSTDFMQVRRYYLGIYTFTDEQLIAGDVNNDGKVNSTDFMQIRRHYLGLFEIEE